MKLVNPIDITHLIAIIPRYNTNDDLILSLYNEATKTETIINNTSIYQNGILTITFNFNFSENDKYQIKVYDTIYNIIYRDKLFASSQDMQKFKATNELYFYE